MDLRTPKTMRKEHRKMHLRKPTMGVVTMKPHNVRNAFNAPNALNALLILGLLLLVSCSSTLEGRTGDVGRSDAVLADDSLIAESEELEDLTQLDADLAELELTELDDLGLD